MTMQDAFTMGGWGMWPTLMFGLLLFGAAMAYAVQPGRRYLPLLKTLGLLTLASGFTGFFMGVIRSLFHVSHVGADERYVVLIGIGESLHNVVLSLVLIIVAAIAVAVGALRLARMTPPSP